MSNETTKAVVATDEKPMQFVPFGAEDMISLTIRQVQNLIAVKTKSGKTCSNNDAIKFMMMCHARRLNPYEGDAFLIGYDNKDGTATFSLITAHQAFLKRAQTSPEFSGMESGIIVIQDGAQKDLVGDYFDDATQKVVGGWAVVHKKGLQVPITKRLRLKRFQKSWGIWQDDPAGMICKCAEADALRTGFPTMLAGMYTREEMDAGQVDDHIAKPIFGSPEITALPAPEPTATEPAIPMHTLYEMCAKDGVDIKLLGDHLKDIGLIESNNLEDADGKTIQIVINSWDSLLPNLKGDTK